MARVVVGVDASEHALHALRAAVDEARLRGAELDVVCAVPELLFLPEPALRQRTHADARAVGHEMIDRALSRVDTRGLAVERLAVEGHAASVLCDVAKGASLLVVGSRGYGGFRGLLVGSVTQHVVAHAPCPVLIVVPSDRGSGPGAVG